MIYGKQALTLEEQADRLIDRGLLADRDELIARLRAVSYYRLSGYLFPFRARDASGKLLDSFIPGTKLDTVWRRYTFDRRLRLILLDAIERIEVAVRTRFVYHFVHALDSTGNKLGPFGYLHSKNLPGFKRRSLWRQLWRNVNSLLKLRGILRSDYAVWLAKLQNEKRRASDTFVRHFKQTYGDQH
jgi:abortive infection bacteriophage resistance protein